MQTANFDLAPDPQGRHAHSDANANHALHLFRYDFSSIENDARVACGGKYLLVP